MSPRFFVVCLVAAAILAVAPKPARLQPLGAEELYSQGVEARLSGNFAEAAELLRESLRREPENVDAQVQLGLALVGQGELEAAKATLARALEQAPDYHDARIGLARIAFWTHDLDQAEGDLEALREVAPGRVDALVLSGQVSMARDRPGEAERFFREALEADPDSLEALIGLGDAQAARWRFSSAQEAYRKASRLQPDDAALQRRLDAPRPLRWRIDVDGFYSRFSGAQEPWREFNLRIAHRVTPATTLSAAIEASERFNAFDTYLEGRLDHRFSPWFAAHALFGGTPNADFRQQYRIGGGAELRLSSGFNDIIGASVATLDLSQDGYASGGIQTVSPGIRQHFAADRFSLTARWINSISSDRRLQGWFLRSDLSISDDVRVFAGASDVPESSDGVLIETAAAFGGVAYDLTRNLTLRASLAHERRDITSDRTVFSVGIGLRF